MTNSAQQIQLTSSKRLLPVRPRPVSGEATTSYLIRVSGANGYQSPRQLSLALRETSRQCLFDEFCAQLNLSEGERGALFGPCLRYWGNFGIPTGFSISDFNLRYMRWCPTCLVEAMHLQGSWCLKLCCACERHSIMLCDQCPHCGQPQLLERRVLDKCNCGASLTSSIAQRVKPSLMSLSAMLWESAMTDKTFPKFSKIDPGAFQRLICSLGPLGDSSHITRSGKIAGLGQLETAAKLMSNVAYILGNWPANFNSMLNDQLSGATASMSIPHTFGRIYHALYSDLRDPCFQILRDSFEKYLHENWWGLVCKRNRSISKSTIAAHPRVTVKEAAVQAVTQPAIVKQFLQAELIAGTEVVLPSGRRARTICQDDIKRLSETANGCMTLCETAHRLKLPRSRVRELISAGVISPLVSRAKTKAAAWLISFNQVEKLTLNTANVGRELPTVSLKQILQSWRLRDQEFPALVIALQKQELIASHPSNTTSVVGELLLEREQVREWLDHHRIISGRDITVDRAAHALGVKQQVAYQLVRNGMLVAKNCETGGLRISLRSIDSFQENYISLAALARSCGRSPKQLLRSIAISPECGPSIDGTRQYFFRKSALSRCNI